MRDWLNDSAARLASEVGEQPTAFELTEGDVTLLLDLARVAAHESGDRTNAPLVSYLVGLAHARHPDRTLRELAHAAGAEQDRG